jgi:multicomponent Na+:H+ antiporter subunit F
MDRLLGLEMGGVVEIMFLVTFALAINRPDFLDLALAMGLLCFGGGLVFARFLERWL